MNARNLIVAAAAFVATSAAFAQGNSEFVEFNDFVSTKTRTEVRAELAQTEIAAQPEFAEFTRVASTKPRMQVRAETRAVYDQGLLNRSPEFVEHVHIASTRSRAEVRDEVRQASAAARSASGS